MHVWAMVIKGSALEKKVALSGTGSGTSVIMGFLLLFYFGLGFIRYFWRLKCKVLVRYCSFTVTPVLMHN
jgi:hypothetical protein